MNLTLRNVNIFRKVLLKTNLSTENLDFFKVEGNSSVNGENNEFSELWFSIIFWFKS